MFFYFRSLPTRPIVGKANWYRYNSRPDVIDTPAKPIKPSGDMLSAHFGKNEFWCRGQEQGTCHCNHSCKVNPRLLELLEQLRKNIGGKSIFVNSGYRCPDHNSSPAVGGARFSQHTEGNAADLAIPAGLSFGQFHWYFEQLPFDGIGLYPRGEYDGWIHVDVRDGGIGSKIYLGRLKTVKENFDEKIISAIYDFLISECDLATPDENGIWRSPDDFCHGSKQIIQSLRNRFVHEKQDALNLLKS